MQKLVWGFIQESKVMEKEMAMARKMICRPCNIASRRHCIIKYNSLSYACIYIPGSAEVDFLWTVLVK
jgi:hypothetical protein